MISFKFAGVCGAKRHFLQALDGKWEGGWVAGIFDHRGRDGQDWTGRDQSNPGNTVGVIKGKHQCNCTTHGMPDEDRPGQADIIDECGHSVSIRLNGLATRTL